MSMLSRISLLSGAGLSAQAVLLLLTPVLTRLYSTEDFGVFAVFSAVLSVLLIIGTLRFELAIPVPAEDKEAEAIISVGSASLVTLATVVLVVLIWFPGMAARVFGLGNVLWLYPLPIILVLYGLFQFSSYWGLREERFRSIAVARFMLLVSGAAAQLLFVPLDDGALGLVLGYGLGIALSFAFLAVMFRFHPARLWKSFSLSRTRPYWQYPSVAMPSALVNKAALVLPAIMIAPMFGLAEAGLYGLVVRVLSAPVVTIGEGFSQVFVASFSKALRQGEHEKLRGIYLRFIGALAMLGVLPFALLVIFARNLFAFVFGPEWAAAGTITVLLVPMMFAQFVLSPVSQVLQLLQLHRWQFAWDAIRAMSTLAVFCFAWYFEWKLEMTLLVYAITMTAAYIVHAGVGIWAIFRSIEKFQQARTLLC